MSSAVSYEHPISATLLATIRMMTACLLCVLGAYFLHDVEGLFGPRGEFTMSGRVLSASWLVAGALTMIGLLTKQLWGTLLGCFVIFSSVAVFLLVVPDDPIVACALIFFLIYLGLVTAIYVRPIDETPSQAHLAKIISPRDKVRVWLAKYRKAICHLLGVTLVSSVLVFGFHLTSEQWIVSVVLALIVSCILISLRFLSVIYFYGDKRHLAGLFVVLLILAGCIYNVWHGVVSETLIFMYLFGLYSYLTLQSPIFEDVYESFQSAPALFVLVSFAILVGLGALFLYLPDAHAEGASITFSEAFFTAISAACVTGLSVINISQELSEFGQFIVLILMQMGGLGIMVLSTFAIIALGGRMGVRTGRAFSEFFSVRGIKSTNQLIIFIVLATVAIELIGALLLAYGHLRTGMGYLEAMKLGIFQAVSAFCNAGFSLTPHSLTHLSSSPWMLCCYGVLIILGGLGFVAMFEMTRRLALGAHRSPLSVQTKIVLTVSTLFIVVGGIAVASIEWQGALSHLTYGDRLVNSFFHSISLRTAGFNTVDMAKFGYPSMVIMLFFMFIGGAPGGTAGGVKVTTFATLVATLPTLVRNDSRVRLFARSFSMDAIAKGSALIILSLATIGVLWFLLLLTQTHLEPMALLFEVFSATGTVGLSLGITESLGSFGRLIVALGMFIGRIGPLTLAIALANDDRSRVEYPSAQIMIG
ncbi:MAG: hypothetical protein OXC40_05815 [Proteobacteria bacterium]|nr:hypothetical protein [Pseudomonadota bacterium]